MWVKRPGLRHASWWEPNWRERRQYSYLIQENKKVLQLLPSQNCLENIHDLYCKEKQIKQVIQQNIELTR